LLKPVKKSGPNLFTGEAAFIKETTINTFKFNRIECDYQWVSFWNRSVKNVMKMMLFVS
jgi:hypothetical protein